MITTKQAIAIALRYIKEVYPTVTTFEVEELELADDNSHWSVTISMPDETVIGEFAKALTGYPKKYKSININAESGQVKAMKIRKI